MIDIAAHHVSWLRRPLTRFWWHTRLL